MSEKVVFEFQQDFETGAYLPQPVGRLHLANGHNVRMYFGKNGLMLVLGQTALDDGTVTVYQDKMLHIGETPKGDAE